MRAFRNTTKVPEKPSGGNEEGRELLYKTEGMLKPHDRQFLHHVLDLGMRSETCRSLITMGKAEKNSEVGRDHAGNITISEESSSNRAVSPKQAHHADGELISKTVPRFGAGNDQNIGRTIAATVGRQGPGDPARTKNSAISRNIILVTTSSEK